MDIFDVLSLVGGLSLFLFGMNIMGQSLERRAGGKLRSLLGKLTTNRAAGLLTGLGITAVIQSSSATTVMVVGFVNSGLMTLKQAINVIMGHGNSMDSEPCRNRQRQSIYQAVKAVLFYACPCAGRHHLLYVL